MCELPSLLQSQNLVVAHLKVCCMTMNSCRMFGHFVLNHPLGDDRFRPSSLPAEAHVASVDKLQKLLQGKAADLVGVQGGQPRAPLCLGGEILAERSQNVPVRPELHVTHCHGDVTQEVHFPLLQETLQEESAVTHFVHHRCCLETLMARRDMQKAFKS